MTAECTNDDKWNCKYCRKVETCEANKADATARPPTPTGWSDTDWLKHLKEHPLAGLHINQGSMDAAADDYEAEYKAAHECSTCSGIGTIDERLGGEWNSNPKAECPDCDGTGELRHNVEFSGGAPLHGASSAGTQG